jgi:hypothetical protein
MGDCFYDCGIFMPKGQLGVDFPAGQVQEEEGVEARAKYLTATN